MIEVFGDAWELSKGHILCITTNGFIKKDGTCVMGRGIAKQAADLFKSIPFSLGTLIQSEGNNVYDLGYYNEWHLYSFPTKHNWFEKSDPKLIVKSVDQLLAKANIDKNITQIYLPRPGCSNGQLDWKDVKPLVQNLDDRFYIVAREEER